MASSNRLELTSGALSATTTGSSFTLGNAATDLICYVKATAVGAGTSLVVKVQHSADGVTWFDLVSFTALTAAGSELKFPATACLHYVRSVCTFTGGTTTATLTTTIHYRDSK